MSAVFASLGMSLDGFIAGPNARPGNPLGDDGLRIHEWVEEAEAWRERQSMTGGTAGNQDDEIVRETFERAGAYIMGRRMFAEGEVGWPDPPPFRAPVFVLTHTSREPWVRQGGTTFHFVTEGPQAALALARKAAGGNDVQVCGGADTVRQFLAAGLLEELEIHLAPIVLGVGTRLFDGASPDLRLQPVRVAGSPKVTHVAYRIDSPRTRTRQSGAVQDHEHRKETAGA
ncbi:dihydrofolate reductase family protein [Streptomyces yangpuensis]|uniref:dihydrofolate reductase family protein n=1 Tax=Streptomyces yangpuensis TaxID=1648182 RepID=UPI003801C144